MKQWHINFDQFELTDVDVEDTEHDYNLRKCLVNRTFQNAGFNVWRWQNCNRITLTGDPKLMTMFLLKNEYKFKFEESMFPGVDTALAVRKK